MNEPLNSNNCNNIFNLSRGQSHHAHHLPHHQLSSLSGAHLNADRLHEEKFFDQDLLMSSHPE